MTELLVGTKKGLVVLRGKRGCTLEMAARAFPGEVVEFAVRDPRSGRYFASVTHGQFGPHLFYAGDPMGKWEQAEGPAFPSAAGAAVGYIAVGGAALFAGFLFVLLAATAGLAILLPPQYGPWTAPLIVGATVIIIGAIVLIAGRRQLKKASRLAPKRTLDSLRRDGRMIKEHLT